MPVTLQIVTLIASLLAITISLMNWWRSFVAKRHDMADRYLMELQKLEFSYPELADAEWCAKDLPNADVQTRRRYAVYAKMAWNFAEALFVHYGERQLRSNPFLGVVKNIAMRHKGWLEPHRDYFLPEFRTFIDSLESPVTPQNGGLLSG